MRTRHAGQATAEFAFVLPVFLLVVLSAIQISLVFIAYYSETQMARETARWLVVNPAAVDGQVAQHVSDTMLPGLVNGSPVMDSTSNTSDAYYHVGQMNVKFTACNPTITTPTPAPPCLSVNRTGGQTLYVEMAYDVSNLIFLPTTFRLGWVTTSIPTTLPAYRIAIMAE